MERKETRELVTTFLEYFHRGADGVEQPDPELSRLLDALALAAQTPGLMRDGYPTATPPAHDHDRLYELAGERFRGLGYYNEAGKIITEIGTAETVVGDAIDDLVELACELRDVAWCWENTSEEDALWRLGSRFRHHWGAQLRSLQLYLHALTVAALTE